MNGMQPRAAVRRTLTHGDLVRLRRVSGPAVSPDGRTVAFVVTTPDPAENRSRKAIHLVDAAGGPSRALTSGLGRDDAPAWSPDGSRIAFVSDRQGGPAQVHTIGLMGGEAHALTHLPVAAIEARWMPDGKRIVFLASVPAGAADMAAVKEALAARGDRRVRARATEDRLYRFWDTWLTDGDFHHLFLLDIASGEITDLTPGMRRFFDLMDPAGSWEVSPDGREVAFAATVSLPPYETLAYGIFTVQTERPGAVRQLCGPETEQNDNPKYSPDGRWLVWGRQGDVNFYADTIRLVRHERSTGKTEVLTADWERSCVDWAFTPDSRHLLFTAEANQRSALYTLPVEGESYTPGLVCDPGWVTHVHAAAGESAVFLWSTLGRPAEIATVPLEGGAVTRLTDVNGDLMTGIALGETREITFDGAGGDKVSMFAVLPPGCTEPAKAPLVHLVHGGPHGCFGDDWNWRWNAQAFAARGWIVAMVNFHGSTGSGESFVRSIRGAQPFKPFDDLMAATDCLLAQGLGDEKRMAVCGPSYGGYLVGWTVGHTGRFRAAVDHAGVFGLMNQFAEDAPHSSRDDYGAAPWDGEAARDHVLSQSPDRFVHAVATPTLFLHGEQDFRVPVTHSLAFYNILKAKGVPSRLVIYPDENHWILKPANAEHWYGEVFAWLDRWLGR